MSDRQSRQKRQEREEREQIRATQLRRKTWIAFGGGLLLAGLIGFGLVRWLSEPASTTVEGRFGGIRRISFLAGTQANGGISPVCGCAHPHLHQWRGIAFAGRKVTLSHAGSPWTQWVVSSAEPSAVELSGGAELMQATAIRLRSHGRFDPFSLINDESGHGTVHLEREIPVEAEKFSIVTPSSLHVGMSGAVPVGAWIPFPGSWIDLTESTSPFPGSSQQPRLVEHYPADVGFWPDNEGNEHPKEPQIFPLGDFLGPNLLLWTDNPQARIVGTSFNRPAGKDVITAVIVSRAVFSTRIAVAPAPSGFPVLAEHLSFADEEDSAEYIVDGSGAAGTVAVTVDQPLSEGEYRGVRQRVLSNPRTWREVPPNPEYEAEAAEAPFWREEHFPPLPRQAGFSVWGPLRTIELDQVHGALTVGDENVDLSGAGEVQINEVQAFRNSDDEELITAPLATSGRAANVQFEAKGTVSVNGIPQSTNRTLIEPVWGVVALLVGFAGSIIALLNGLLRIRERGSAGIPLTSSQTHE
jgi:hypothetical protein